jgi:drug/metabolite transporter (DMT)-like permease
MRGMEQHNTAGGLDSTTGLAFAGIVGLGGLNGISISVINDELYPFWGATLRFGLAALVFLALVGLRQVGLPRGRPLIGSTLYGALGFGVTFALASYALVDVPPGFAQVILALVPLLTLLLAVVQGLERWRWQSAFGSVVALLGVVLVVGERLIVGALPLVPVLAILAAAIAIAESSVLVKLFPRSHPLSHNAVAMSVGALILVALSLVTGEAWAVPTQQPTLLAIGYLVLVGSVVVFMLFLIVIERWTASATSYALLLMPLVTVVASALLRGEQITTGLIGGGALVLVGVYLGAFAPSLAVPLPGLLRRRPADAPGPPALETPNCP